MLCELTISREGVLEQTDKMKPNKSSGPDKVYTRNYKECRVELSSPLGNLFKKSRSSGDIPGPWKFSHVVPVIQEEDRSLATNFRQMSLTSAVGWLLIQFEATLKKKNSLIKNSQHVLTKGRSCLTNLLSFFSRVRGSGPRDKDCDVSYPCFVRLLIRCHTID